MRPRRHTPQPDAFIDRLYQFSFRAPVKNCVLYASDFCLCMGYIILNVLVFQREETRVLYESVALSAVVLLVVPLLVCWRAGSRRRDG